MEDAVQLKDHLGFWITRQGDVWKRINITHPERRQWYKLTTHAEKGVLRVVVQQTHYAVSRLVYSTFVGALESGLVVCHLNGDFRDNRPENLYQGTQKENIGHKRLHGTHQAGEKHPRAKITNAEASAIKCAIDKAARHPDGKMKKGEAMRIASELNVPLGNVYSASWNSSYYEGSK